MAFLWVVLVAAQSDGVLKVNFAVPVFDQASITTRLTTLIRYISVHLNNSSLWHYDLCL